MQYTMSGLAQQCMQAAFLRAKAFLDRAGVPASLQKYAEREVHQRASSPKLQVMNTALMTASMDVSLNELQEDRE